MRAFIAVDLPEALHAALERKQAEFRCACPEARWTRLEGIHLTLKFLGEITDQQVTSVTQALVALGSFARFSIEVRGFGFFPDARRPRVFWVGLAAPPNLAELAERVEQAMEKLGFPRENRPFKPHLTLARFNTPRPLPALLRLLESTRPEDESQALGRFEVSEFFLYESKLSPHGAEYIKLSRFPP